MLPAHCMSRSLSLCPASHYRQGAREKQVKRLKKPAIMPLCGTSNLGPGPQRRQHRRSKRGSDDCPAPEVGEDELQRNIPNSARHRQTTVRRQQSVHSRRSAMSGSLPSQRHLRPGWLRLSAFLPSDAGSYLLFHSVPLSSSPKFTAYLPCTQASFSHCTCSPPPTGGSAFV